MTNKNPVKLESVLKNLHEEAVGRFQHKIIAMKRKNNLTKNPSEHTYEKKAAAVSC